MSKIRLPLLRIEVAHKHGVEVFDPTTIIMFFITHSSEELSEKLQPVSGSVDDDGIRSVLSGHPALIYRAQDYEIALALDELARFVGNSLRPDEFHRLFELYGEIHEIHYDFYDQETGEALQPRIEAD